MDLRTLSDIVAVVVGAVATTAGVGMVLRLCGW
jgi:hypothetical protein